MVEILVGAELVVSVAELVAEPVLDRSALASKIDLGQSDVVQLDDRIARGGRGSEATTAAQEEDEDGSDHADEDQGQPTLAPAHGLEQFSTSGGKCGEHYETPPIRGKREFALMELASIR